MKTEFKIAPEQITAWDAFASVVRTSAKTHNNMIRSMAEEFDDGRIFNRPLPKRLGWQIAQMEARLQQIKTVKDAADDLYAVLAYEQKAVADDIVLPMTGMGMGRNQSRHMLRWRWPRSRRAGYAIRRRTTTGSG
ncbi:hypothetical protein EET67_23585 [Pseudaminobacter arsenicus]|uniref:Uncharacterized protein n=1 Tax=Borborobacter arsenicus TaxID=1851146 RepID=A0A432UZL8_9HYPH|nr:hypothetical protein EET67_23585 [Pseudaminobacter arsenicus]